MKKSKLLVLPETWQKWYFGRVDTESVIRFSNFLSQNSFFGKFGSKKLKYFLLPKIWRTYYLKKADSESGVIFPQFRLQNLFLDKFFQKNILWLFWFETLLLFLDILLLHFTVDSESTLFIIIIFVLFIQLQRFWITVCPQQTIISKLSSWSIQNFISLIAS